MAVRAWLVTLLKSAVTSSAGVLDLDRAAAKLLLSFDVVAVNASTFRTRQTCAYDRESEKEFPLLSPIPFLSAEVGDQRGVRPWVTACHHGWCVVPASRGVILFWVFQVSSLKVMETTRTSRRGSASGGYGPCSAAGTAGGLRCAPRRLGRSGFLRRSDHGIVFLGVAVAWPRATRRCWTTATSTACRGRLGGRRRRRPGPVRLLDRRRGLRSVSGVGEPGFARPGFPSGSRGALVLLFAVWAVRLASFGNDVFRDGGSDRSARVRSPCWVGIYLWRPGSCCSVRSSAG